MSDSDWVKDQLLIEVANAVRLGVMGVVRNYIPCTLVPPKLCTLYSQNQVLIFSKLCTTYLKLETMYSVP